MNRLSILTAGFGLLCAVASADEQDWTIPSAWWQTSLERHLMQLGDELDCYFTLEAYRPNVGYTSGKPIDFFEEKSPLVRNPSTIDDLVKELRTVLPNVGVHRSKVDERIIHLAERRVVSRDKYSLNQEVTIDFTGILGRLPSAIGTHLPRLGESTRRGGDRDFNDCITEVSLSAKDEQVRSILTRAVPLKGYQRILWRAVTRETWLQSDGTFAVWWPETKVQYYGPYRSRPVYYSFYLAEMGNRLKCHFTMEFIALPRKRDEHVERPYLVAYYLEPDYSIHSIEDLVVWLRAQLKGMEIRQSERVPNVIHLIERPLPELENYVLSEKVSVKYEGTADRLPNAIGKADPRMASDMVLDEGPRGADWGSPDWSTRVAVDYVNMPIRDMLTESLPLDTYGPLLWRSVTYQGVPPNKTIVRYLGPAGDSAEAEAGRSGGKQAEAGTANRKGSP